MTTPGDRPPAPPAMPFRPMVPAPLPSSYFARIVSGVLLAIVAASVLAVGITEVLAGKVDPGSVGAMVFLAGLTALGVGLSISGVRAQREAREAVAHALEHQLLELASKQGGALTIPLVSLHLSVPLDRARAMLDALAVRGGAEVRVADDATLLYEVPGLGPRPLRAPPTRLRAEASPSPRAGSSLDGRQGEWQDERLEERIDERLDERIDEADAAAAEELFVSARKHPAPRQS